LSKFNELYSARFTELVSRGQNISINHHGYTDYRQWTSWVSSCLHLLDLTFGRDSAHYSSFKIVSKIPETAYTEDLARARGIIEAAKEDWDKGFANDLDSRVSSEIFADLLALAKHSLHEGHKDTAAVLASAALEDTLKRFTTINGLQCEDQEMDSVINSLRSKGLLEGPENKLIGTYPKIRNAAMHAEWSKIKETEVGSLIGFTEQFLLSRFS
jgi:hypothetical protein